MNYVVLDFEMCNVPRKNKKYFCKKTELIQVGAVIMDDNYTQLSTFSRFIKPTYGELDDYIEKLTGIHAKDLSKASHLPYVLDEFVSWIRATLQDSDEYQICTWSNADYLQLHDELIKKDLDPARYGKLLEAQRWIDYQKLFSSRFSLKRNYNLVDALKSISLPFEGHAHDGLVDAINTARLMARLASAEEITIVEIPSVNRHELVSSPLGFELGGLFAGITLDALPA